VEIQETERRFVSRELHDQAGQGLTSLIIGLGALERVADQPEQVRARAVELKSMTSDVMEDLHRLAINLRPISLDHLGLLPALEQLARSIAHDSNLTTRVKTVGLRDGERLPQDVETAFYRIAQEALNNIMRHARASRADVMVERRDGTLLILIEDNGKGFNLEDAKEAGHLGLLGIQERAETLGGKLTVESAPGKGTTLVVEVPDGNPHLDRR
jgi:signal transduction histidine kinase